MSNFDGDTIIEEFDEERLGDQLKRVFKLMKDEKWRTLNEIQVSINTLSKVTSTASISARLRDLRKIKNGGHTVERQRSEPYEKGIFQYRLILKQ